MNNYKPWGHETVSFTYNPHFLQDGELLKYLSFDFALSTTAKSLWDASTGATYQVPTGKTFFPIEVRIFWATTPVGKLKFYSGDTANASDDKVFTLLESNRTVQQYYPLQSIFQIESTKYMTANPGGANIYLVEMLGYET